jgi:hypothetical protein
VLLGSGWLCTNPEFALFLFGWSWATRVAVAALMGKVVVREPHLWRKAMLYPLRDLLGFPHPMPVYPGALRVAGNTRIGGLTGGAGVLT